MTGSVPPADTTTPTAAAASPTNRLTATTTRIGHRVCRRCVGSAGPVVVGGVVAGSDSGSLWWVAVTGGRTAVS